MITKNRMALLMYILNIMLNFLSEKKMILTNIEWQFLNGKRNLMLIKMYDNMF